MGRGAGSRVKGKMCWGIGARLAGRKSGGHLQHRSTQKAGVHQPSFKTDIHPKGVGGYPRKKEGGPRGPKGSRKENIKPKVSLDLRGQKVYRILIENGICRQSRNKNVESLKYALCLLPKKGTIR